MKTPCATLARIAVLAGLVLMPAAASAQMLTLTCRPDMAAATPPEGTWLKPLKLRVDLDGRAVELVDGDTIMVDTLQVAHLAQLANYDFEMAINENVIKWGYLHMWGFSGFYNRKAEWVDLYWVNRLGFSPGTLNRQFHGRCKQS